MRIIRPKDVVRGLIRDAFHAASDSRLA